VLFILFAVYLSELDAHRIDYTKRKEKTMHKRFTLVGLAALFAAALLFTAIISHAAAKPGASGYHVIKTIPVPGDEGWDYVYVDSDARRVYISHASHVVVMNADTYAIEGSIPDTPGVHGIAVASEFGRGFISNGRGNNVTIFDLKTLKTLGTVKTDQNPDAIIYDPATKRVFTFNGRGKNSTVINPADGSVVGTIPLGDKPEFAVADGNGAIFVNGEDTSNLVALDSQNLKETHRWPLAPCKSPSGLAGDLKSRRLFSVCDDKVSSVVDADSGKVVANPAICDGPDAAAFDPALGYFFASCGDGNLTVIHEDSPDKFSIVETVATKKSARTMGLDLKTHKIFLPSAEFDPPAPGERRGKIKPGTFAILVVGK
jgi:DNA-binding beta-propeller fold protein YncE